MKRIPGVSALLIALVAFVIPYVRAIITALEIPHLRHLQPYLLNVAQVVWFTSLLGAIIIFAIAAIFAKTWRGGLCWVIAGVVLLGSGWYSKKAVHQTVLFSLHGTNQSQDPDVQQLRTDLEKLIPLHTPLTGANARMVSVGFACTAVDAIRNPIRTQFLSVPAAMRLTCKKEDRWPKHARVIRRWEVEFSFPPHQSPNPGVDAMQLSCDHYFGPIFLSRTYSQKEGRRSGRRPWMAIGTRKAGYELVGPASKRLTAQKVLPKYPTRVNDLKIEEFVRIYFTVSPEGEVRSDLRVIRTTGKPELDAEAKKAIQQWQFVRAGRVSKDQQDWWGIVTFWFPPMPR